MNNEKMQILKMLEEGKITAGEAARLLESVGNAPAETRKPYPSYPSDASNDPTGRRKPSAGHATERLEPPKRGGTDSFAEDLSRRFEHFFKDFEPKLQKITETVVEKTSSAADAIARSLSTPPPPKPAPTVQSVRTAPAAAPVKGRAEKSFEIRVVSSGSELIMPGFNGQVLLKGYNGDKISAKIFYVARRAGAAIDLMAFGNKYYLNYDESNFDMVSVDAYVPESMFDSVKITTTNGVASVSTLKTRTAQIITDLGDIEASGLTVGDLMIETGGGNMRLSNISAERASVENMGGGINAADIDVQQLRMLALNGGVLAQISRFHNFSEYMWAIESNNGRLNMILPSSVDLGYCVKANAALSDVKIGLTGLSYVSNSRSFAEAQSVNYDHTARKIKLLLETSNAPLTVN